MVETKKLNEILDGVFCINLENRPDRLRTATQVWGEQGVTFERAIATPGGAIDPDVDAVGSHAYFSREAAACTVSHLNVWEAAFNRGMERIMVIEDDAQPCADFQTYFAKAYKQLPNDFTFCYLGGGHQDEPKKLTKNTAQAIKTKGSYAYIIDVGYATELARTVRDHVTLCPIDDVFCLFQTKEKWYELVPRLVAPYWSYSDVGKHNDYSDWLRDLPCTEAVVIPGPDRVEVPKYITNS